MSNISVSANVVATSSHQRQPMTVEQAIGIAEADLAALRAWVILDHQTPMLREVGGHLIAVGAYLRTKGRR